MSNAVIDPQTLHDWLEGADGALIRLLDATYGTPGYPASAIAANMTARIGNAQFFDVDVIADPESPYMHTAPSAELFAVAVGDMGISENDTIVIYDQNGMAFAAARAWWLFRLFGHKNVFVLNGGLPAWRMAGLPLQSGPHEAPAPVTYTPAPRPGLLTRYEDLKDGGAENRIILDARPGSVFMQGHIPGSASLPFMALMQPDGRMKDAPQLEAVFSQVIEKNEPLDVVVSCNSGITACVLALGIYQARQNDASVFDGSWTEWKHKSHV